MSQEPRSISGSQCPVFADGSTECCIHAVYSRSTCVEAASILRFVALRPVVTKFTGFVWGRTRFPAAPAGAAGNPALKALKDDVAAPQLLSEHTKRCPSPVQSRWITSVRAQLG